MGWIQEQKTDMGSQSRETYWKAFETKRLSHERYGTLRIAKGLQDQIQTILDTLPEAGAPALLAGLDQFLKTAPLEQAYQDLYGRVGADFARTSFSDLSGKSQKAEDDWIEFMRNFAINEAGTRIQSVSNVTLTRVRRVLQDGIDRGLGIEEIAANMERSNAVNRIRARVIARTEIVSASNRGSKLGAESTGLTLEKYWIVTPDGRERETHSAAASQSPIAKDEMFIVGGHEADLPGDPNLPPEESIQCRCSVAWGAV